MPPSETCPVAVCVSRTEPYDVIITASNSASKSILKTRITVLGLGKFKKSDMVPMQTEHAAPEAGGGDPKAREAETLERIGLPRMYRAKAWRILYVTRDYKLAPILSTGIVVLPANAPANKAARKFIAWAHPTTGVAWKCAPSPSFHKRPRPAHITKTAHSTVPVPACSTRTCATRARHRNSACARWLTMKASRATTSRSPSRRSCRMCRSSAA